MMMAIKRQTKSGMLMLKNKTNGKTKIIAAFNILNKWFFYGVPAAKNIREIFEFSCAKQQKEILVALRYQNTSEEIRLAEELSQKFSLSS